MLNVHNGYLFGPSTCAPFHWLNMHNGLTNGKVHMYSDKQIPGNFGYIFLIQGGQVSEGGAMFASLHVNCLCNMIYL